MKSLAWSGMAQVVAVVSWLPGIFRTSVGRGLAVLAFGLAAAGVAQWAISYPRRP